MAALYLRSSDGSDSDNGSTWALSKATMAGIDAIDAAGDTVYVDAAHSESTNASLAFSFAGTSASPTKIYSANSAAEPPTAVSEGATISTGTGASANITISGNVYMEGVTIQAGVGNSNASTIQLGNTGGYFQHYKNDKFRVAGTNTTSRINIGVGATSAAQVRLENCSVRFSNASQGVSISQARIDWEGGGVESGGTAISTFIRVLGIAPAFTVARFIGLDLSSLATACDLIGTQAGAGRVLLANCKLPASWSGVLVTGGVTINGLRVEMHNCDSGNTNYRHWIEDYNGSIKTETTIVRSSGASDGTTAYSLKMTASANVSYPFRSLELQDHAVWNESTGSSKTISIEIVHDAQGSGSGGALRNSECWLEVQYLGDASYPLGSYADDSPSNTLGSTADQTSSSVTWTTTGLSSPVKQTLAVTFTPQKKGPIVWRVRLAKASAVVYVCPKATVA